MEFFIMLIIGIALLMHYAQKESKELRDSKIEQREQRIRENSEIFIMSSGDPKAIDLLTLARSNQDNYYKILIGGMLKGNETIKTSLEMMAGININNNKLTTPEALQLVDSIGNIENSSYISVDNFNEINKIILKSYKVGFESWLITNNIPNILASEMKEISRSLSSVIVDRPTKNNNKLTLIHTGKVFNYFIIDFVNNHKNLNIISAIGAASFAISNKIELLDCGARMLKHFHIKFKQDIQAKIETATIEVNHLDIEMAEKFIEPYIDRFYTYKITPFKDLLIKSIENNKISVEHAAIIIGLINRRYVKFSAPQGVDTINSIQ